MNRFIFNTALIVTFTFLNIVSAQTNSNLIRKSAQQLSKTNIQKEPLFNYVAEKYSDPAEISEFLYYWLSMNIEYDDIEANKNPKSPKVTDVLKIWEEKKAICIGYATLYKDLLAKFGIESEIIHGYVKSVENLSVEPEIDSEFSHAWNAVKINGNWILVDVTWANQDENGITDFYFNPSPEQLVLTHYPIEKTWQLIKEPLSLSEFNELPLVQYFYFQAGFQGKPKLYVNKDYYYFEIEKNSDNNWLLGIKHGNMGQEFEPIDVEILDDETKIIYRFSKNSISNSELVRMDLGYLDIEKQVILNYYEIAFFRK